MQWLLCSTGSLNMFQLVSTIYIYIKYGIMAWKVSKHVKAMYLDWIEKKRRLWVNRIKISKRNDHSTFRKHFWNQECHQLQRCRERLCVRLAVAACLAPLGGGQDEEIGKQLGEFQWHGRDSDFDPPFLGSLRILSENKTHLGTGNHKFSLHLGYSVESRGTSVKLDFSGPV